MVTESREQRARGWVAKERRGLAVSNAERSENFRAENRLMGFTRSVGFYLANEDRLRRYEEGMASD